MGLMGRFVLGIMVVLVLMMAGFLNQEASAATQHVVGGSQGWDESTDFKSWASSQTFKVGDQLVFKYTPGLHSVVELAGESAYKSCDIGTALDSKNGGNDVIKLDKAGTRYFACGTAGHCGQGMKVKITTVAAAATGTPTTSDTPSSTTSTAAPASSSAYRVEVFAPLILLPAFCWILGVCIHFPM